MKELIHVREAAKIKVVKPNYIEICKEEIVKQFNKHIQKYGLSKNIKIELSFCPIREAYSKMDELKDILTCLFWDAGYAYNKIELNEYTQNYELFVDVRNIYLDLIP